jgi:hypothetical protein
MWRVKDKTCYAGSKCIKGLGFKFGQVVFSRDSSGKCRHYHLSCALRVSVITPKEEREYRKLLADHLRENLINTLKVYKNGIEA